VTHLAQYRVGDRGEDVAQYRFRDSDGHSAWVHRDRREGADGGMAPAAWVALSNLPDYWRPDMFPGLAIFLTVYGFNLLGDRLRDMLDPRDRVR